MRHAGRLLLLATVAIVGYCPFLFAASNLVQNPNFDSNVNGWSPFFISASWDIRDASDSSTSGSLRHDAPPETSPSGGYFSMQCLALPSGSTAISFGGTVMIPSAQTRDPVVGIDVRFYGPGSACEIGSGLGYAYAGRLSGGTGPLDVWTPMRGVAQVPAGAGKVAFYLYFAAGEGSGAAHALYDDAFLHDLRSPADFTGDGTSDVLWRNSSTAALSQWLLTNGTLTGGGAPSPGNPGATWFVAAIADLNGDNKSDLVLRDSASGETAAWLMDGATYVGGGNFGVVPVSWKVVGTGDFDANGKRDLVWYNRDDGAVSIWLMDGAILIGGGAPSPGPLPMAWQIASVADFSGDGKSDLLWRNTITGVNAIWFMDGINWIGGARPGDVPDLAWKVVGSGEFDADDFADIVWRNESTGAVSIWLLNAGVLAAGGAPSPGHLGTAWRISTVGDFNGDAKTDLWWRNSGTGVNSIWFMDGVTWIGGARPGDVADPNWQIVPTK